MEFKHLIDLNDYTIDEWKEIIDLALEIEGCPEKYSDRMRGKILATLFYEPSTRTQMSFQTAMLRLGGQIIGFDNPQNSSVAKGENLKDTVLVVSKYADIIAMRHPLEGAAKAGALTADCPVINAGDGGHLHPTQTLTDLVTLSKYKGEISGLTVGFCGDLKYGRTVHSLVKALCCFENIRFVFICPKKLTIPEYILNMLDKKGCFYTFADSLSNAMPELDVLYMTRIQKERFDNPGAYLNLKDSYILSRDKLSNAKEDLCVLHPLPRVDEIEIPVDFDPRAKYFEQANLGVYARMALILFILENSASTTRLFSSKPSDKLCCPNKRCITASEKYLPAHFSPSGDSLVCEYCDTHITNS